MSHDGSSAGYENILTGLSLSNSGAEACHGKPLRLENQIVEHFRTLRDPVYRYVVAALGNPAEAEEVTQDVFLKLLQALQSGQSISNIRAWVFRVAHNTAIDRRKKLDRLSVAADLTWENLEPLFSKASPHPEARLLEMEKFSQLHAAVAQLSDQQRRCLELRAEGLRYREIAEVLEISLSSVAEFLGRAIHKLMRNLHG